jgi:hypothetical protein
VGCCLKRITCDPARLRAGLFSLVLGLQLRGAEFGHAYITLIVPGDKDVYLVEVDLDNWGRVWTEADSGSTDLETLLSDMAGQYRDPVRVIAFNTADGWSRRRCKLQQRDIPATLQNSFIETTPATDPGYRCRCAWCKNDVRPVRRNRLGSARTIPTRPGTACLRLWRRRDALPEMQCERCQPPAVAAGRHAPKSTRRAGAISKGWERDFEGCQRG